MISSVLTRISFSLLFNDNTRCDVFIHLALSIRLFPAPRTDCMISSSSFQTGVDLSSCVRMASLQPGILFKLCASRPSKFEQSTWSCCATWRDMSTSSDKNCSCTGASFHSLMRFRICEDVRAAISRIPTTDAKADSGSILVAKTSC